MSTTDVMIDPLHEEFVASFEKNKPNSFPLFRSNTKNDLNQFSYPNAKQELWKYSKLNKLAKEKFTQKPFTGSIDIDSLIINSENSILVFVNGYLRKDLSKISDIENHLLSIQELNEDRITKHSNPNYFTTLNGLYFNDGAHLIFSKSTKQAVELIFISEGEQVFSPIRNSIELNSGINANVYITYFSHDNKSFVNSYTDILLEKNSNLNLNVLQIESEHTHHYNFTNVSQNRDSVFTINTFSLSGAFIRNDLHLSSNGENTETNLNGLYLLQGEQFVDNHTVMDHRVANCISNELYKGVIDDQATAVFNGKVFVRQDAQKINAFQSNANILLSDDATINSKPELEIYADDVKCSHGSTIGQLDEEAIFYLRARGISEKAAKQLMIGAFAGEVMDKIKSEFFRNRIENLVADYFSK